AGDAPGLDQIADPCVGALQPQRDLGLLDQAEPDELSTELGAQLRGLLIGVSDQQRMLPTESVGQPRLPRRVAGLLKGAGIKEPALLVILLQDTLITGPQAQ